MKIDRKLKIRYSRETILFVSLFCLFMFMLIIFFQPSQGDRDHYAQLIKLADPSYRNSKNKEPHVSRQAREMVRKDYILPREGERLHYKIYSEGSEIVLDSDRGQSELVEYFDKVICYLQEEQYYILSDGRQVKKDPSGSYVIRNSKELMDVDVLSLIPMQIVKVIKADRASYHFKSDHFIGYTVDLASYELPGHQITPHLEDAKLLMEGKAEQVKFGLFENGEQLEAQKLKAKFYDTERKKE